MEPTTATAAAAVAYAANALKKGGFIYIHTTSTKIAILAPDPKSTMCFWTAS